MIEPIHPTGAPADQVPERRQQGRTIREAEAAFERQLQEHEIREQARIKALIEALKIEAFPDGAEAHRAAHQAMIDAARQEAEFWRDLKFTIAKKSIWGILQILGILVLAGIAAKFGLGALAAGAIK